MEKRHRIHPIILQHAREMRHPQTPAEATVWRYLRNRNLGFKFRRQHPIVRFIIDFYCAELITLQNSFGTQKNADFR